MLDDPWDQQELYGDPDYDPEAEDEYDWQDRQDQGEREAEEYTDRMAEWDIRDREDDDD